MKIPTRRQRILNMVALVAGVTVVFAAAAVVSRTVFERPHEHAPLPLPARRAGTVPSQPELFQITALEGDVEAQHDGTWALLQAGDYLSLDDVVRTPPHGRVILRRGAAEIEVSERSQLKVDMIAHETARFAVVGGAGDVSAAVTGDHESLEITSNETATVNQGQARWVVSGRNGRVNVASSAGVVSFTARGQQVLVRAGHESHANPGEPPSEPEGIPPEVLLSVFWPERTGAGTTAQVRGKTRASTRVRVNGQTVPVEADGTFTAPVQVGAGGTPVSVQAEDITGRRKEASNVLRAARAPVLEPKKEDLWKK